MSSTDPIQVTRLLNAGRAADPVSREEVERLVHAELRKIAARLMKSERRDHTLQPTALANDAFMGLMGHSEQIWMNRAHFFGVAARAMRHILVDHSRRKSALKRGGNFERLEDIDAMAANIHDPEMLITLDQALDRLAAKDKVQAGIVELRYFGGLTEDEVADVYNICARTVRREWICARAWLFAELSRTSRGAGTNPPNHPQP